MRHDSGTIFSGRTNVKLFSDANNDPPNLVSRYYPGSSYVDGFALDGFNFGGQTWQ